MILAASTSILTKVKIAGLGDVVIAIGNSSLPPGGDRLPKNTRFIGTADQPVLVVTPAYDPGSSHISFTTEFSLPSAIELIKPLKAILNSDNIEAQKVAQKVFKTSAVGMRLSAGHSAPYEFYTKPRTVALNW